MTFIATLIALVIERFFHWGHLRHWHWFDAYQRWLSHSLLSRLPSYLLLITGLIPIALIIGLINYFLGNLLYGSLKLIFGAGILLYCMGPANIWVQAFHCIANLHKEDPKAALEAVQAEFGVVAVENSQFFHQAFTRAIFLAAYQRIFAVIFWFVILGPIGAILYRSIALMTTESPLGLTTNAREIQRLLDWIPIRLLTFIFALSGHFTQVFAYWKQFILKNPKTNETMLTECGIAALDVMKGSNIPEDGAAETDTIVLLDRVFVMSLVILAILVLTL